MKKLLLICFLLICYGNLFSQTTTAKINLIGTWKGTDDTNQTGYMKFTDSSHVIINAPGEQVLNSTYIVDFSKDPALIDITTTIDNITRTLPGFLLIVDQNTIKWQVFFDKVRPEKPVEQTADNTLEFRRVTE